MHLFNQKQVLVAKRKKEKNKHTLSIYLSIGINVRFAAMMADVGDGLL